jgi:hypothetical protein
VASLPPAVVVMPLGCDAEIVVTPGATVSIRPLLPGAFGATATLGSLDA